MGLSKVDLLNAAAETVGGRGKSYGRPEDNFGRIATHWQQFFINSKGIDVKITPGDVAILFALMKIARLEYDPKHVDSWTDLAGYAACGAEIETADGDDDAPQEPSPSNPLGLSKRYIREMAIRFPVYSEDTAGLNDYA